MSQSGKGPCGDIPPALPRALFRSLLGRSLAAGCRALAPRRKRGMIAESAVDSTGDQEDHRHVIGTPRPFLRFSGRLRPAITSHTARLHCVALLRRQVACVADWSHAQRPRASLAPR